MISSLPTSGQQQSPNYDAMYRNDTTPLVNAATPGFDQGYNEPTAANESLGSAFGGSLW
jgi:hypothetical protein